MDREIQQVELNLTDVGRRCNPKLVEKKRAHVNQIKDETLDRDGESDVDKQSFGAQLALLHRCTTAISKTLRKRGSPLLVAKLLVICRLLHKTLSQNEPAPPFLEDLRNQLASLRRTLLKRTDKRLAFANSSTDDLIEVLAAYCLATSSSSDDAVRHFHQLRLEAIGNHLETDVSGDSVVKALGRYIQTLQSSKVILSRRLSDTLSKFKARPLLSDPEICNLGALGIDVLGRWVTPDINNFTPWIKLSELSKPEAEKVIKQWSSAAFKTFVQGCEKCLPQWADLSELLSLRKQALDTWLESWSATPAHSSLGVLEGIRTVFNKQLTRILADEARKLQSFGQRASSMISEWESKDHANVQPLWDQGLITTDYSNGAAHFKQAVVDRLLGRNEDVSAVLEDYQSWLSSIEGSRELLDEMRRSRWVDILDEDEDPDIDITAILNEDDPRILSEALQASVQEAFNTLQSSFNETPPSFGPSNQAPKAAFALRLIRHVRRGIPSAFIPQDFIFSAEIVPQLQDMLAAKVVARTDKLAISTDPHANPPGRTLWEGDPELPVQPSPPTFKFLRRLIRSMDDFGMDLWDPATVGVLKGSVQGVVAECIESAIGELESSPEDTSTEKEGEETQESNESTSTPEAGKCQNLHDRKIQLFFDTVYLLNAFATTPHPGSGDRDQDKLSGVVARVRDALGSELTDETGAMEKMAAEYWKRSKLLFGLLRVD